jgi:hypothetical protein
MTDQRGLTSAIARRNALTAGPSNTIITALFSPPPLSLSITTVMDLLQDCLDDNTEIVFELDTNISEQFGQLQ